MKMMRITLTIILLFVMFGLVFGQNDIRKTTTNCGHGIQNGNAVSLPKPVFPLAANYKPRVNTITVAVEIGEDGNVIKATAISGHPLFRTFSEKAAQLSKFSPSFNECERKRSYTEIQYKFDGRKGRVTTKKPIVRQTKYLLTTETPVKLGIINGRATFLPKPIYPQAAKDFCIGGKAEVEVLVDESGNVIEAKAISGDELLRESSVEAVKKAKFNSSHSNVKTRGIIVYNFDSVAPKCIDVGIVNKKALSIPKPWYSKDCNCTGEVIVKITVDWDGNVKNARAISGHPILRNASEKSARKAKFNPTLITAPRFLIRAKLVYIFNSDGTIEF
jgi:TonB family protein